MAANVALSTLLSTLLLCVTCQVSIAAQHGRQHIDLVSVGNKSVAFLKDADPLLVGPSPLAGPVLTCGENVKVDAHNGLNSCPAECPYSVEDSASACAFSCVRAQQCGNVNPGMPVPHEYLKTCGPRVLLNCNQANQALDRCENCNFLYHLGTDGNCHIDFMHPLMWFNYALAVVILLVLIVIVVWVCDLCCRREVNQETLKHGLAHRSRRQLRTPQVEGGAVVVKPWPLLTNLLKKNVAGIGILLHFHFQFTVIFWASVVAIGWIVVAVIVDKDLFVLGTRDIGTPRENCALVAWGHDTQERLTWIKVYFLIGVYIFTFLGSIAFSINQQRLFREHDHKEKSMNDYAARIDNLPPCSGTDVEDQIKSFVTSITNMSVIGVSVCWDFHKDQNLINKLIDAELDMADPLINPKVMDGDNTTPRSWKAHLQSAFKQAEKRLFLDESTPSGGDNLSIPDILLKLQSGGSAFVVFETESDRNKAVEIFTSKPATFRDNILKFTIPTAEPEGILWENFHVDFTTKPIRHWVSRCFRAFATWFVGMLVWFFAFYYPYFWSVSSFDYSGGREPGLAYSIAFTIVIVIGNQLMYLVCAQLSDDIGFDKKWEREACYMVTYLMACVFNVLLDLGTTYVMVWERANGLGFHTFDGRWLFQIEDFKSRFQSYAVQRLLGENMFYYAVPSTFLVCFLFEPVATIFLPLKLGQRLVCTHATIQGRKSEKMLASPDMDMGRYADILLNVLLSIFMFFFPAGYIHQILLWLAFSHAYIYFYDHWRLLRSVPQFSLRSPHTDYVARLMLVPSTGLILSAVMFQANCTGVIKGMCVEGIAPAAFVFHCVFHLIVIIYVVPMFDAELSSEADPTTFGETARLQPHTWFSVNPVHCLRSKYIHSCSPPCVYAQRGKEHLLKVNEKIGCYFHGGAIADNEEASQYDVESVIRGYLPSSSNVTSKNTI